MLNPTKQAYEELQTAYVYFNNALFNGILPNCLITMQRKNRVFGYFSRDQWENRHGDITDEIAMNPKYFSHQSLEEVSATLVHEMTHLWQKHYGKSGRGRYHNKQWADKMESIGLMPSNTGKPGGKRTGDQMLDYVIEGGPFSKATDRLSSEGFTISWIEHWQKNNENNGSTNHEAHIKESRHRYLCPFCNIKAWGKPGLYLICGNCRKTLI